MAADALPFGVPNEVPVTYEVPEAITHVKQNHNLAEVYSLMGEHTNIILGLMDKFSVNYSAQIDEMKNIIMQMTVAAQVKINDIGENAFPLPEQLVNALAYLDVPWPPVM